MSFMQAQVEFGTWVLVDGDEPVRYPRRGGVMIVPKLYRIWRKPRGIFGCWVVFRVNGKDTVPDLSTPEGYDKLPHDAEPLTDSEALAYWTS